MSLTREDEHSSYTSDSQGSFRHPFLEVGPEVTNIHYPKSSTFSVKLTMPDTTTMTEDLKITNLSRKLKPKEKENNTPWKDFVDKIFGRKQAPLVSVSDEPYQSVQDNYYNLQYTGSLFFGTPSQELPAISWDTAVGESVVETTDCSNCEGPDLFDGAASSTHSVSDLPYDPVVYYDESTQEGLITKDRVCLSADAACVNDFEFISLT